MASGTNESKLDRVSNVVGTLTDTTKSGLPWRAHAGMDALREVRGGAGDAAPVLGQQPRQPSKL
jgi:hypothetical protein